MKTRRRAPQNSLNYQRFEDRRLLAGNVIVNGINPDHFDGDLRILGDAEDNVVEIRSVGEGNQDILITGQQGTTINGQASLLIENRNGANPIENLRIHMGSGNDRVFVEGLDVQDRTAVYGGHGNDSIGFYQTKIIDDLFIATAYGDDLVSLDEVEVGDNLVISTLYGSDTVAIDASEVKGRTLIYTGDGSDRIGIRNSTHHDHALILTGRGNDFVGVDGVTAKSSVGVFMGKGHDELYVNDSYFGSWTVVSGQYGYDKIQIEGENTFKWHPKIWSFKHADIGGAAKLDAIYADAIVGGARLGTITELVVLTPELQALEEAVIAAGLADALNGEGTFTAFAPINEAFEAIEEVTSGLTVEQLTQVLLFHVSGEEIFLRQS